MDNKVNIEKVFDVIDRRVIQWIDYKNDENADTVLANKMIRELDSLKNEIAKSV